MKQENLGEKGYEISQSVPDQYQFNEQNQKSYQAISEAYEAMWSKIYPYFRFDRSVIEKFYTPFDFEAHLTVLKRVVWYDLTPGKTLHEVLGYMNSISAYQCYLEDHNIPKGSSDDPWVILRNVFLQEGQRLYNSDVLKVAENDED